MAENKTKTIDITALSRGRRVLVTLCDLAICFIISWVLFMIAVQPSANAIIGYDQQSEQIRFNERKRNDMLYEHEFLYYSVPAEKYFFEDNLNTTFNYYLSCYVENEFETSKKDVIKNYFVTYKNDNETYFSLYKDVNNESNFFDITETSIVLKSEYVEEFVDYFNPKAELGEKGKKDLKNFKDNVFAPLYSKVISDIEKNDLIYEGYSYNTLQKEIKEITFIRDNSTIISSYISMFLGLIICYIVVPLVTRNRKTLSMMFLRVERVRITNFTLYKKSDVFLSFVYHMATNMVMIFLIPIPHVSMIYVFNLPSLLPLALISLAFLLASLIFMFANKFGRTLTDYLMKSLYITTEDLDEIYRHKGYKV